MSNVSHPAPDGTANTIGDASDELRHIGDELDTLMLAIDQVAGEHAPKLSNVLVRIGVRIQGVAKQLGAEAQSQSHRTEPQLALEAAKELLRRQAERCTCGACNVDTKAVKKKPSKKRKASS